MSESYVYQVSIKYGTNGQHMLNVRADNAEDFAARLRALPIEALLESGAVLVAGNLVVDKLGGTFVSEPAATTPAAVPTPQPPAVESAAPPTSNGAPTTCAHGARVRREAKPGSGKQWVGWFCPTAQGTPDQCKAEFEKKSGQ